MPQIEGSTYLIYGDPQSARPSSKIRILGLDDDNIVKWMKWIIPSSDTFLHPIQLTASDGNCRILSREIPSDAQEAGTICYQLESISVGQLKPWNSLGPNEALIICKWVFFFKKTMKHFFQKGSRLKWEKGTGNQSGHAFLAANPKFEPNELLFL